MSVPDPLSDGYKSNFQTLLRAAEDESLLLLSAKDKLTGENRAIVCAHYVDDDGDTVLVPLAKLFDGDPYEELEPPIPDYEPAS